MYVPAHTGVSPNAMADAAAKAYLHAELDERAVRGAIEAGMESGRWIRSVAQQNGQESVWDSTVYDTTREAVGWWVRAQEWQRLHGSAGAVDEQRIG